MLSSAPVIRVWDPARPTHLLTDASELAVSVFLEHPPREAAQPQPLGLPQNNFTPSLSSHTNRRLPTQPELSYPPMLELLSVVYALKKLRPYLLDKPFELHKDNASLRQQQQ